jgi:phosphoglycerol transferase
MTEVRRSLAAYLVALAACAALLVVTFELWRADLRVPLSYGMDSVCTQLYAKTVIENGWYLNNPALGAPFGLEMHDFPLSDGLFFLLERAIAATTSRDAAVVVNLYYFGTYFLTTVVALAVLRRLGVARGPAVVCALLYAFLPYHMHRGERHLFLSSYFLVPLAVLVCVWIYRDGELLFREGGRARLSLGNGKALAALATCVLLGSGGVYYAAFSCYLLLVAGACAAVARRKLHPLGSAAILAAVIAAGVAANVAPKVLYAREHGPNPAVGRREPSDVEFYALKVAQLLLPEHGHRVGALARLRERYDRAQTAPPHENDAAGLGVVGAIGFLALLGAVVLRRAKGEDTESTRLVDGLAALNIAALLLATTGGLGAVVGFVVSPLIRCYNRISVFIAFFALAAVALGLARLVRAARPGWPRLVAHAGLAALLVVGVLDQTTRYLLPDYEKIQRQFASDAEFVGRIEASLPPGASVFQLPLNEFPEGSPPGKMGTYDPARAYLHAKSLRWSFGAMKGRYADAWQKYAVERPTPETLRTIALAGFSGVWVDRDGYADRGAGVEAELAKAIGAEPMVSPCGRFTFFDVRPFVANLRRELGPDRWAAEAASALRPMVVTWHGGFYGREGAGDMTWHWSDGSGEVRIANPTDRPRAVEVTMGLVAIDPAPSRVAIAGPDGPADYATGSVVKRSLVVPPGGATLTFSSDAKRVVLKGDPRTLAFRVEGFRVVAADGPASAPVAVGDGATKR